GGRVIGIEVLEELARLAEKNLARVGLDDNAEVRLGDGGLGAVREAPFDLVILSCAAPEVPAPLFDQVKRGGRLLAPIGTRHDQVLHRYTREEEGWRDEVLGGCRFVPMVGTYGF
ncbi:MAG: protein-L-isoaspartate O-methyltransferase, partial [Candidatus Thermoplasmatota archaeon]|nr:protein-L-isoaspartate O-methyltransferase [Candidatus Thermoplasmatota archaeon]